VATKIPGADSATPTPSVDLCYLVFDIRAIGPGFSPGNLMTSKSTSAALVAALALLTSTAAQAEIICTNRGCYETGMRIFRNGGAYRGLAYYNHRDMAIDSKGYPQQRTKPVRIRRDSW
jgi:hypothetical protein